jgi:hypothetical protein
LSGAQTERRLRSLGESCGIFPSFSFTFVFLAYSLTLYLSFCLFSSILKKRWHMQKDIVTRERKERESLRLPILLFSSTTVLSLPQWICL